MQTISSTDDYLDFLKDKEGEKALKVGSHFLWFESGNRQSEWRVGRRSTLPTKHSEGGYIRSMIEKYDVEVIDRDGVKGVDD